MKSLRKLALSKLPDYYPGTTTILQPEVGLVGKFGPDYPIGATVHYTASENLELTRAALVAKGLNYHFMIDRNGSVAQTANLGYRVNHAGRAIWRGQSPNRTHIAIALVSWGILTDPGVTWTGRDVPQDEVRKWDGNLWHSATVAQEKALWDLLSWLCDHGIDPRSVCGHDEACLPKGRKVDPGGVLLVTMPELREALAGSGDK